MKDVVFREGKESARRVHDAKGVFQPDDEKLYIRMLAIAVVAAAVFSLCVSTEPAGLKKFSSVEQLSEFLQGQQESYGYYGAALGAREISTASGEAPQAADKSGDYSTTNIQVAGVDEADFVKNDGKYIYTIAGGSVVITDAYPAEGMKILSTINLSGASQLYINGDRLVVFGNNYYYSDPMPLVEGGASDKIAAPGIWPGYGRSTTYLKVYDVSDHASPVLKRDFLFNGSYYNSRMIGDKVYSILTVPTYGNDVPVFSPYQRGFPDIYYFDVPSNSYQYTNIVSLDVKDDTAETNNKVFLLGYSTNMYVSENNIYLVYQKQLGQYYAMEKVLDITLPLLPADVTGEINSIRASGKSDYRKYGEIQLVLNEWMQNNPQAASLEQQLSDRMQQVYIDIQKEQDRSVVHKIAISGGDISYIGSGEVPGMPLNQFSMDESSGYFRIATTSGQWQNPSNNLYVLNGNRDVVGKLENLAPDERIFSARFIGDRAYLVTFVRIDPLFVIDLSDPASPKVLGELKIPGVSDYLHPYDENTIIGIGRSTSEIEDRVTFKGLKISLFDVSDVANPVEKATYEIGDRGTYSEALNDHHAFLFSPSKHLMVLPVTVYEQKKPTDFYGEPVFNGAYAFTLTGSAITYKGRVTHANSTDIWSNQIRRSLYMDDALYTVSDGKIKANTLDDFTDISSVELPRDYYGGPIYIL